jgi:hypothetical protein
VAIFEIDSAAVFKETSGPSYTFPNATEVIIPNEERSLLEHLGSRIVQNASIAAKIQRKFYEKKIV